MAFDLKGRTYAVTGAAGDIGGVCAAALAANGAQVTLLDLDEAGGHARAEAIGAAATFRPLDVSDSAAVDRAFEAIHAGYGRLDGLVNAAGIAPLANCWETTDAVWRKTLDINLSGVHYASRAAARIMRRQRRGVIVNVSSTNGLVGEEQLVAYNASKFGVMGVTKTMAAELGDFGIRVVAVNPGFIETQLTAAPREDPEFVRNYHAKIPLRRFGKPEEVAAAIVFLLSDDASFITGTGLVIDGGQICH
ncbi:MAG: SDR family oxidoreductase [Bryobacterales bacterium]|nr:SDR family oxidoreductase [Bryobacterales bacterium]